MDKDSPEPNHGDPGVVTELRLLYGPRHCRHCGDNALLVDYTGAGAGMVFLVFWCSGCSRYTVQK